MGRMERGCVSFSSLFIRPRWTCGITNVHLLWLGIVIDEIVYDCTNFVHEHPGGTTVIESFGGAECSCTTTCFHRELCSFESLNSDWLFHAGQFWRFHSKYHLREHGHGLRLGRSPGIINKFKEPRSYVGLRGLEDES